MASDCFGSLLIAQVALFDFLLSLDHTPEVVEMQHILQVRSS